ncbi:MAG: GSU2403 family nucleotidyltransferase fold protein [Hyphomicrobiaceae bacterium]|nr:GSU2403 family nucleotidyltransferase fold protein [Hyphomicrobiaceae bacterium]
MAPRPIPLNLITLYADLAQSVPATTLDHGSVVSRTRRGRDYYYVVVKDGVRRSERYLGAADDPVVADEADAIAQAAEQARARRTAVSALKQARIPAPSLPLGRVMEVLANAGLFAQGVTLIGTAAFQTYACMLGYHLPGAAVMTNDADLLVASFVSDGEKRDLEEILQRADPTFRAEMSVHDRLPKLFRSANSFAVDVVTKYGRGRKSPLPIEELGCSAEALTFMEYLAEDSVEAVALYGAGVLVRVPPPLRYAIHKLLVAQERQGKFAAKKPKDLAQARDLIDIMLEIDEEALLSALDEARARGKLWKANIGASLKELGRDPRQGQLPVPPSRSDTGQSALHVGGVRSALAKRRTARPK